MPQDIPASDWKVFRKLQPIALDRFCQRVLAELTRLACYSGMDNNQRYLAIYTPVKERDKELANMFDGLSRSNAMFQLMLIQARQLLKEEEMAQFTPETRERIRSNIGNTPELTRVSPHQRKDLSMTVSRFLPAVLLLA